MGRPPRTYILINGEQHFKCCNCGKYKPKNEFNEYSRQIHNVHTYCKICQHKINKYKYKKYTVSKYNFDLSQEGTLECKICGKIKPASSKYFLVQRQLDSTLGVIDLCLDCSNSYTKSREYWYYGEYEGLA